MCSARLLKLGAMRSNSDLRVRGFNNQSADNWWTLCPPPQQLALCLPLREGKDRRQQKRRMTTSCSKDAQCFSLSHSGQVMNQGSSSAEPADGTNRTLFTLSVTHIPWAHLQMFVPLLVFVPACMRPCVQSTHEQDRSIINLISQPGGYLFISFVFFYS